MSFAEGVWNLEINPSIIIIIFFLWEDQTFIEHLKRKVHHG